MRLSLVMICVVSGALRYTDAAFWSPMAGGRTFPGRSTTRPTTVSTGVSPVSDDLPDIVKAYRKIKTKPSFADITVTPGSPSLPDPPAAVPEDVADLAQAAADAAVAVVDSVEATVEATVEAVTGDVELEGTSTAGRNLVDDFVNSAREAYESVSSSVVDSPRSPDEAVDLGTYVKNGVDAVREVTAAAADSAAATITTNSETPNKVPTLFGYIKSAKFLERTPPNPDELGTFANIKAKVGLLVQNTFKLFGISVGEGSSAESAKSAINMPDMPDMPEIDLQQINANFRNMQAPDMAATLAAMPPGSVGWATAGVAILVASGQRRAGIADAKSEMKELIAKEAEAVAQLAKELDGMSDEISSLKTETRGMENKLQEANARLNAKELELSRERLKLSNRELTLNNEIMALTTKLKEGNAQISRLEDGLKETEKLRDELKETEKLRVQLKETEKLREQLKETEKLREQLIKTTAKLKEMEAKLVATQGKDEDEISRMEEEFNYFMNEVATISHKKPGPEPEPEPESELEISSIDSPSVRVNGYIPDSATTATVLEAPTVTKSKKTVKTRKSPAKRTIKVKKSAKATAVADTIPVPVEPTVTPAKNSVVKGSPKVSVKASPKASAKIVVKSTPEAAETKSVQKTDDSWGALSDSTLMRKTIKELTAYLEAKDVRTTDETGKTKKKALLVKAIKTL